MLEESIQGRLVLVSDPVDEPLPRLPRDLIDFHLRWREFRPATERLLKLEGLDPRDREILRWLIALADRVNSDDVSES